MAAVTPTVGDISSAALSIGALQLYSQGSELPSLTPIHDLPPEVLSHVFEIATAPGLTSESSKHLITLCLVCKAWRGAALAHPPLWSSLYVKARFTPRVYDKVQAWFRRAGTLPKSLAVHAPYHTNCWISPSYLERDLYTFDESAEMRKVCEFAASYLAKQLIRGTRLDHLSLYCPSSSCLAWITKRLNLYNAAGAGETTPWDTLRSLRLAVNSEWGGPSYYDDETQQAVDEMFRTLPPVTSLHVHLPEVEYLGHVDEQGSDLGKITISNASLTRLTRLTFDCDWHFETILDTIRPCLNLVVLTLHFKNSTLSYDPTPDSSHSEFSANVKDVILPQLEILRIRQANPVVLQILRHFDTSILAELDVSFKFAGFSWNTASALRECQWQDHIAFYISRSNCLTTVRRLRLHGVTMSGSVLQDLITTSFPWITNLALDSSYIKGPSTVLSLQNLTTSEEFSDNVPQLRTINLIRSTSSSNPRRPISKTSIAQESWISSPRGSGPGATPPNPRIITFGRKETQPPQLENYDTDWSPDPKFDSWNFNTSVRGSLLHTLEHDYL